MKYFAFCQRHAGSTMIRVILILCLRYRAQMIKFYDAGIVYCTCCINVSFHCWGIEDPYSNQWPITVNGVVIGGGGCWKIKLILQS